MRTTTFLLLLAAIVFFSSCSKLPVYKSEAYAPSATEGFPTEQLPNYDKKTDMSFSVSNSETDLFVEAVFHDAKSYQKIMRGGLYLYFDPMGKKKKNYKLKIERSEKQAGSMSAMSRDMRMNPRASQNNLPAIIQSTLTKVTWDKDGNEFVFYRNLIKDPIRVDLGPNQSNELVLKVKIPLKEIPLEAGQNLFSMGIESGAVSSSGMGGQRPGGGMGGGMGGGKGGGGHGGGGGGMKGGGMKGGGMQGGMPQGVEPFKLWFQVEL